MGGLGEGQIRATKCPGRLAISVFLAFLCVYQAVQDSSLEPWAVLS